LICMNCLRERKAYMSRENNGNIRRERFIMVTSSVFVLAALTLSGIYMRNQNIRSRDDGYTIDFSAIENSPKDKLHEIAENRENGVVQPPQAERITDELEVFPMENSEQRTLFGEKKRENSEKSEISKSKQELTTQPGMRNDNAGMDSTVIRKNADDTMAANGADSGGDLLEAQAPLSAPEAGDDLSDPLVEYMTNGPEEELAVSASVAELHFADERMVRPVVGEILIKYSMNGSVYFATLDQYKYNPGIVYKAQEGDPVSACADGKVLSIRTDPILGNTMELDLGDGCHALYGQLKDIEVAIGERVTSGMRIASVAATTKYFATEGPNLYFEVRRDGESVDPESFFE